MSKRFFKPVRKDLEWGPELLRDAPRLSPVGSPGLKEASLSVDALSDALAFVTIKAAAKQPSALATYNAKVSEFTKELAASRPDLLPKDRVVIAREMYKRWKASH